jgi:hypothetical protein
VKRVSLTPLAAAAFAAAVLASGVAAADEITIPPKDEAGFTAYFAEHFATALPQAQIVVRGPLELAVTLPPRPDPMTVDLNRIWNFCVQYADHCAKEVAVFVPRVASQMTRASAPIQKSAIRVVVRNEAYVERARRKLASLAPGAELVARPLVGELWVICVLDESSAIEPMTTGELPRLGVSADEAFALGKENVAAALPPASQVIQVSPKPDAINYIPGHFYDSSRILLHEDWATVAEEMDNHLVVAVPVRDGILYINGSDKESLEALKRVAEATAKDRDDAISTQLFRWVPDGWELVNP